jgi:hypothetical protein
LSVTRDHTDTIPLHGLVYKEKLYLKVDNNSGNDRVNAYFSFSEPIQFYGFSVNPIPQLMIFLLSTYKIWESIGFTSEKTKKIFTNFNVLAILKIPSVTCRRRRRCR